MNLDHGLSGNSIRFRKSVFGGEALSSHVEEPQIKSGLPLS